MAKKDITPQQGHASVTQGNSEDTGSRTPKHATKKKGLLARLGHRAKLVFAVAAVVAALLVGFSMGNHGIVQAGGTNVDSTTIKNSFQNIAELATQEYEYTDVGKYSKEEAKVFDISIPFTGSSFLITYSGSVKAGIADISQSEVNVDDSAKTVTVMLPQVQVLGSHIDSNSVETYDQTYNPISQISVDEVTSFLNDRESTEEQKAIDIGLLDKARTSAEQLITNQVKAVLQNTNQSDYQVVINWSDAGDTSSTEGAQS